MGDNTAISWADATINTNFGCTRVSAGCQNCYAEQVVAGLARKMAAVNPKAAEFYGGLTKITSGGPRWTSVVKLHEEHLLQPLRWREGRRIFVNSLSDTFHESLSFEQIARVFAMAAAAPQHTFMYLTKRPERMAAFFKAVSLADVVDVARTFVSFRSFQSKVATYDHLLSIKSNTWPLPSVWLGTSVESQEVADERISHLVQAPAAIRFISAEPLLTALDISSHLLDGNLLSCPEVDMVGEVDACAGCPSGGPECAGEWERPINWVICGAESGPNHRPMEMRWALDLRDQCKTAGVAFFFKQDSSSKAGQRPYLVESDGSHTTIQEFPASKIDRTFNRKTFGV